jgi:hypothetical protein
VADYSAGQAYLQILPSLTGFGDKVREQLKKEFGDPIQAPVKPTSDPADGGKQGEAYGSAFGEGARSGIDAALKDLPSPNIDVNSTEAERKIATLRTELDELRDKKIGVDISSADFLAKVAEIKATLEEIAKNKTVDISVRADAAAAFTDLAAISAEADKLDGKTVRLRVTDDGSANESKGNISALMLAGVALGPAIIPVAAAVAAAIGAIGIGAISGIAAIGAIKLGFMGVGTAVTALDTAQQQQGQNAAQLNAQQISTANSLASAHDAVAAAVVGVTDAERAEGIANQHAAEQTANAQRALDDAYRSVAQSVQSAVLAESQAEQTLQTAEQSEQLALVSLTAARQAAQRQIESLTLSVQDGALAERQAQLGIEQAKLNLDQTLANPTATTLQREQAQLTYDQAVQQLTDVQARNKNLQQDQQAAVKAGVDGSQQVQAAQRGVVSSTQAVASAQQGVITATDAVTEARRAGAEKIASAQQSLTDAEAAQAETARAGAESVAKAEDSVTSAERALTGAMAQAAAQAASTTGAANALATAMGKLGPAGQEFAHFVHDDLEPKVKELQATAEQGLLPGVEAGLKAAFPIFPQINALIGSVSTTIGDMAKKTGEALNSPFWKGFFDFLNGEAAPSLRIFGTVLGNIATGGAAILEAFKPVWDQMGQGVLGLSQRFADFSKNLGQNTAFQQFLDYVKTEGPKVMALLGDLIVAFTNIGRALGPLGGVILTVVDALLKFINALPPAALQVIVDTLYAGYLVWKGYVIISTITGFLKEYEIATKIATAAQWLWNAAMDANPIGIIIVTLAALVVGVIYCYTHFQTFRDIVSDAWTVIKDITSFVWNVVLKPIFDLIVAGLGIVGNGFHILGDVVSVVWNGIKIIFDAMTGNWQGVVNAFNTGMNSLQDIWNRLINIAKVPVNFVIDAVYNHGIVPVWNGIAGVFGLGVLQPAALLAEGGVIPGYSPGVDSVPAMLSKGEGVLVPEAVRGLGADFVYAANAHFSGGRAGSGSGGPNFSIGGVVGDIASIVTDPVGSIKSLFAGVVGAAGNIPGAGLLHQALVSIPGKIIDAVIAKAKAFVSSIGSSFSAAFHGSADLAGWIAAALAITGTPESWAGPLSVLIGRESGGNPNAINLTDSNAAAGHPSQGLMQTIPGTFNAYHQAGTSFNINDPVANIAAGINYIKARYGSIFSVQQANPSLPPKGYDAGGWLPPGLTLAYNGTGQHERVLTGSQYSNLTGSGGGSSNGGGRPINVNVYPRENHSEADIADMVSRRLAFTLQAAM